MQFKRSQRQLLAGSWGSHTTSWFFHNLGEAPRSIIEQAYGLKEPINGAARTRAQEDVTAALTIFSRRVGCEKSHVVHALLTGSIDSLKKAIRKAGKLVPSNDELCDAWEASFRDINMGSL